MSENYIKACTTTRDRIADFLDDYREDRGSYELADTASYVQDISRAASAEALNIVLRNGMAVVGVEATETVLASPWISYEKEGIARSSNKKFGDIRLEAVVCHSEVEAATLASLGDVTLRLVAKPTGEASPQAVAIIKENNMVVRSQGGSDFIEAELGDVNHIHGIVHRGFLKVLTRQDDTEKREKERDLDADRCRKGTR